MKHWSGRFTQTPKGFLEEFLSSIHFDKALAPYDILGSLAHAKMLEKVKLINQSEFNKLKRGLKKIKNKIEKNKIKFTLEDEDIHLNIETLLKKEIGETAGKLHAGRSRNDQVALDLHLYLRQEILNVSSLILQFNNCLLILAEKNTDDIMPGFTHLQHAQPILFSHHILAYLYNFKRDFDRLQDLWKRINILPLGSCALAGSDLPLDRSYVAKQLGFDSVYENSIDAISNRDGVVEYLASVSLIMMHLSRFSEEIILWSTQEFDFIELADKVCTGSSIMPQKKNPDVAELIRGKTGRAYGSLLSILTVLKSLPLSYNKDLQEDKECLFDASQTVKNCLQAAVQLINGIKIKKEKMFSSANDAFSCATLLANYLTKKQVPFRSAHHVVGSLVQYGIKHQKSLSEISLSEYKKFSPLFEKEIYLFLDLKKAIHCYKTLGSTSPSSVKIQIDAIKKELKKMKIGLDKKNFKLEAAYEQLY